MRRWHPKGKGKEAKLSYNGNLLVENRNGLIVKHRGVRGQRDRRTRCRAGDAGQQIPGTKQVTVGGDKGYDTADFVASAET